jgi:hypothetical protein
MILKQYYLGCLAHASYLLGDEASSTAVIVDPQREVHQYLADAEKFGFEIRMSSSPTSTPTFWLAKASCVAGCSTPSVCFNRAAVNQNFSGQSTRERTLWLVVKKSKFANS